MKNGQRRGKTSIDDMKKNGDGDGRSTGSKPVPSSAGRSTRSKESLTLGSIWLRWKNKKCSAQWVFFPSCLRVGRGSDFIGKPSSWVGAVKSKICSQTPN